MLSHAMVGVPLVMGGALLLSTKGIFAKLLYQNGVSFETLVACRAVSALPIFWLWGLYRIGPSGIFGIRRGAMLAAAGAGVCGYTVGQLVNFYALTLIPANLERVLLFSYPVFIVVVQAIVGKRLPGRRMVLACLLTYSGIFLAVGGFDLDVVNANLFGGALVLAVACTTGAYLMVAARISNEIGSITFTVYAMTAATVGIVLFSASRYVPGSLALSAESWRLMAVLVVLVTVLPVLMIAEGIKRIGAARGAIVSTVGPPFTILATWLVLEETMTLMQLSGSVLILAGILVLELRKNPATND